MRCLERNAGLPSERRIEFCIGIHLGDVVEKTRTDRSMQVSISRSTISGGPTQEHCRADAGLFVSSWPSCADKTDVAAFADDR